MVQYSMHSILHDQCIKQTAETTSNLATQWTSPSEVDIPCGLALQPVVSKIRRSWDISAVPSATLTQSIPLQCNHYLFLSIILSSSHSGPLAITIHRAHSKSCTLSQIYPSTDRCSIILFVNYTLNVRIFEKSSQRSLCCTWEVTKIGRAHV